MEKKVLEILAEICEDDVVLEDRTLNLLETGLLDSVGFVELMVDLEQAFGIELYPAEMDRNQLDTPDKIIDWIRTKVNE